MKTDYISEILHRYFADDYPPELQQKLQAWLVNEEKAALKEEALLQLWNELNMANDDEITTSLLEIKRKLGFKATKSAPQNKPHAYKRSTICSMIAISLLCLIGGWWYYLSARTEWINVTTAYGEKKLCILPDSSSVWINAGSTFRYPSSFKGNTRTVQLSGEAWFNVKRNHKTPFIIQTNTCHIQVLGTVFNVSDYRENSQMIVQLETGKVEVTLSDKEKYLLSPHQQLIRDKATQTSYISPITSPSSAWKDGELIFENTPFPDILRALERHYNVNILFKDVQLTTDRYSIRFEKNEPIEQALDLLQELTESFTWSKNNKNQFILQP